MKPAPFEYIAPTSLPDALTALAEHGFDAKLLAGGQSLVPVMNFRLAQPGVLIDLNGIDELDFIRQDADSGELRLGGLVRHRQLAEDETVATFAPLLHETMPFVAHSQIRNRGTLGGSLAHADPAAELPVILVTLNGRFRLQSTSTDRWINAEAFFIRLFETACGDDEILVEVAIPPLPPRTGCAFVEISRRHGDFAMAGVAAVVTLDENEVCTSARLVYLNLGDVPIVAQKAASFLVGKKDSEEVGGETAVIASQQEINPTGDIHATADYKRHLAKVLTGRVLKKAFSRAVQAC